MNEQDKKDLAMDIAENLVNILGDEVLEEMDPIDDSILVEDEYEFEDGYDRSEEVKSLVETARLAGLTLDWDNYNAILDRVYKVRE